MMLHSEWRTGVGRSRRGDEAGATERRSLEVGGRRSRGRQEGELDPDFGAGVAQELESREEIRPAARHSPP